MERGSLNVEIVRSGPGRPGQVYAGNGRTYPGNARRRAPADGSARIERQETKPAGIQMGVVFKRWRFPLDCAPALDVRERRLVLLAQRLLAAAAAFERKAVLAGSHQRDESAR